MSDVTTALERHFRFLLDEHKLTCRLRVDPGYPHDALTADAILAYLDAKAVQRHRIDEDAVKELIEAAAQDREESHERVVAKGEPPIHGQDSVFEFDPEIDRRFEEIEHRKEALRARPELLKGDATDQEATPNPDDSNPDQTNTDGAEIDYYNTSAFVIVDAGEVVGKIKRAVPGTDGTDIFGGTVLAKQGKSCHTRLSPSINVDNNNVAKTTLAGKLDRDHDSVTLDAELNINGFVDFSTGNIRFPGRVNVAQGVRSRFEVQAGGPIRIGELVEAATIDAGDDLTLLSGMAGRETGHVEVARSLSARYLDGVEAIVAGHVEIASEVSNSKLRVGGRFNSPNCTVRGGELIVAQRVEVLQLGGEGGVNTTIKIGTLPGIESNIARLLELSMVVQKRNDEAKSKLEMLQSLGGKLSASQAEELTELEFEQAESNQHLTKLIAAYDRAIDILRMRTMTSLTVRRTIHPGVQLYIPGHSVEFRSPAKGPLLIEVTKEDGPVYGPPAGAERRPLSQIAAVTTDLTVPTPFGDFQEALADAA